MSYNRWPYRKRTNLVSEIHNHLEGNGDVIDSKAAKLIANTILKGAEEEKPFYFGSFPATPTSKSVTKTVSPSSTSNTDSSTNPSNLFHSFQLSSKYSKRQKSRQQKYQQLLREALHPNGTPSSSPETVTPTQPQAQQSQQFPTQSSPQDVPQPQQGYVMRPHPHYTNNTPSSSYLSPSSMYNSPQTPNSFPGQPIYYPVPMSASAAPMMYPAPMHPMHYGYPPQMMYSTVPPMMAPVHYIIPQQPMVVQQPQVKVLNGGGALPSFSAFVEGCGVEHISALQKRTRSTFEEGQTEDSHQEPVTKKQKGKASIQDILNNQVSKN